MRISFYDYFLAVKKRRTEDDYNFTDEQLTNQIDWIKTCYTSNMSVYKCLELMENE